MPPASASNDADHLWLIASISRKFSQIISHSPPSSGSTTDSQGSMSRDLERNGNSTNIRSRKIRLSPANWHLMRHTVLLFESKHVNNAGSIPAGQHHSPVGRHWHDTDLLDQVNPSQIFLAHSRVVNIRTCTRHGHLPAGDHMFPSPRESSKAGGFAGSLSSSARCRYSR